MLDEKISTINSGFNQDISAVKDLKQLEELRIKYFSRNGLVSQLFDDLKNASKEEKPLLGKSLNSLRNDLTAKFES